MYDHYQRQVVSLVILSDDHPTWRPDNFEYALWGSRVLIEFPAVKLLDYRNNWVSLEANDNPFALVVMAHLRTLETSNDDPLRRDAKFTLIRLLHQRGYKRHQIIQLLRFIDWIMTLSSSLEKSLHQALVAHEETRQMEYVTSFERIGIEKGIEQGIRKSIVRLLNNRFGDIPEAIEEKLQSAGAEQLEQLLDEAIIATDLPAFATFADQLLTR